MIYRFVKFLFYETTSYKQ